MRTQLSSRTELAPLLFAGAQASVHFALRCLEPVGEHLRATSTFVDAAGEVMHWHDFGDLEGPGWAANAIGGALLLARWGCYTGDASLVAQARKLADHVLQDGFVQEDGFIWPYWDLAKGRFCLNYAHNDAWLCPGSLAKVGVQMLELAGVLEAMDLPSPGRLERVQALRQAAEQLGMWLEGHVPRLDNGWVPRRITLTGEPYPLSPEGGQDPIFDHSADGLFLLSLWTRLGRHDLAGALGEAFVNAGGFWGSINHDTYDDHENVAYAVAFRALREAADALGRPAWRSFAYEVALPAMARFRMDRDEHGVVTEGLFWMERSWDTAYLWENAEVAQAHLEAWLERGETSYRDTALGTLWAIAHHHYGSQGFLSEGIDWNNHVSQRHHEAFAYYGAIRYTEPLLNNLHLVEATLTYLQAEGVESPKDTTLETSLVCLAPLNPVVGVDDERELLGRTWLRLSYPAIATDEGVRAALDFAHGADIDGVLLFEASYDTDPALLSLEALRARFKRLRAVVPRFREAGLAVHINVMITMGHVDAGGGHPDAFELQFLVDSEGAMSRSTACPLDQRFVAYAEQIYAWAGACGADAVWVDDDVRFLWHDLAKMTCFCPLHLAAMTERTGRTWTREALVAALADATGEPGLRRTWLVLQAEAIEGLAARIAAAVRGEGGTAAGTLQIGLMSVGTTVHHAEGRRTDRLLRVLAGDAGTPLLRPGSGFWHDWAPAEVLVKTEDVARQVAYLGKDVRVVAEIENHPYSPFQKSQRMLALEMALNVLAGTHDLSLNILSSTMPFVGDARGDAEMLRGQKPFLRALARARAGKRRVGVGVEDREDVAETVPNGERGLMGWVVPRPWEVALSRLGLPVGMPYDAPHLLTGAVVYTDRYALGSAFQEGALLTPGAVRGLLDQGWGDRLGIRDVVPAPVDANELFTHDGLNGEHAGVCLPVRHYAAQLGPQAFVLSEAVRRRILSGWVGLKGHRTGVAVAALELSSGHRIGLLPFEIETVSPALLHPARRDQWAGLLAWVGRRALPLRVVGGVNLVPQVYVSLQGAEVLVALINLSADAAVACLAGPVWSELAEVERLTPEGVWVPLPTKQEIAVAAWDVTVVRGGCR